MTEYECRQILGLAEHFTIKDLKHQYRRSVLKYHPDRNNGNKAKFIQAQKAYNILLNFKQNPAFQSRAHNRNYANDIFKKRREAEEAYKKNVQYYRRKTTINTKKQVGSSTNGLSNLRYVVLAILLVIGFSFLLLIAFAFGRLGVIALLIIIITLMIKFDPYNLKF